MTIPDVVAPLPALLLDRTKGQVGWFVDRVALGDGEVSWNEAVIVFWNLEKAVSGTISRCGYN